MFLLHSLTFLLLTLSLAVSSQHPPPPSSVTWYESDDGFLHISDEKHNGIKAHVDYCDSLASRLWCLNVPPTNYPFFGVRESHEKIHTNFRNFLQNLSKTQLSFMTGI